MLPVAQPLAADTATRWAALAVPWWVPKIVLTGLWAVATGSAVIGNTGRGCGSLGPAVCGPDHAVALWLVAFLATPVLLVWMPLAGCVAGIAVGSANLTYGGRQPANLGFDLHALACAAVAGWLVRSAAAQQRLVLEAVGGHTGATTGPVRVRPGRDRRTVRRRCCVVLLVAVTAGLGWARLRADPADSTGWECAAFGAVALALTLALQDVRCASARRRLSGGEQPALAVRALPDGGDGVLLLPAAGSSPGADLAMAKLDVGWWWNPQIDPIPRRPSDGTEPFDDPLLPWSATPTDAVLLGSLRGGGWVLLLTEVGVLVPWTPVRALRVHSGERDTLRTRRGWLRRDTGGPLPTWDGDRLTRSDLDEPRLATGQPVSPAVLRAEPELPCVPDVPARIRLYRALLVATAVLTGPAVAFYGKDLPQKVTFVVVVGRALFYGADELMRRLRITTEQLEITGVWWVVEVPWERVRGVRRDRRTLSISWHPRAVAVVGPFAGTDAPADRDRSADRAEQLGAAMLVLRARSAASGSDRAVRRRPSPLRLLVAGYVLVTAAAFWFALSSS